MHMKNHQESNVLVAKVLEPRLDAAIAGEFNDEMRHFMSNGIRVIVLNLSEVEFIDSCGLGAIVTSFKQFRPKGEVVITGTRERIMSLLKLNRLDRVFRIFPTDDEALEAISC